MEGNNDQPMSSCKKLDAENCEKRDDSAEHELNLKPLKKAQYVWQIKGNYHLKNSSCDSVTRDSSLSKAGSSVTQDIMNGNSGPSNSNERIETERTPTFCKHHKASESEPDASFKNTCEQQCPSLPSLSVGATAVHCTLCDTYNENVSSTSINVDGEESPSPHPDWIRKWQTRQIAQAFMDNTINRVLDEMGFTPVPESAPDSDPDDVLGSINFGRVVQDSVEEEEEDESVENEGILSAIQRHGLQRHTLQSLPEARHRFSYGSSSPIRCSPPSPKHSEPNRQLIKRTIYQSNELPFSSEAVSVGSDIGVVTEETLSPADMEAEETGSSSYSNTDEEADDAQNKYISPSSCRFAYLSLSKNKTCGVSSVGSSRIPVISDSSDEEESNNFRKHEKSKNYSSHHEKEVEEEDEVSKKRQGNDIVSSSISKRRCMEPTSEDPNCSSSSLSQSSQSSQLRTSADIDSKMTLATHSSGRNSPTFGHFEFMDAAVAAAIQKKGLSALACQDL